MGSRRSISFRKREAVDEVYVFPVFHHAATLDRRDSTVMVEYDGDEVLIIAGDVPGMQGYYKSYPEVVDNDERRRAEHEFARDLLTYAEEELSEFDPRTSSSKSNSGNRSMRDLYVRVDRSRRDEVVLQLWKVLNEMRDRYVEFLDRLDDVNYREFDSLEAEVVAITKRFDCSDGED